MSTSPSPSRLRSAWQGGVRPDSAWLGAGIGCVALSGWLRWGSGSLGGVAEATARVLREPSPDLDSAMRAVATVVQAGLGALASIAVLLVAAGVLAAALMRRLGPVRPEAARGLGIGPLPQRLRVMIVGAVVLAGASLMDLQRRVAGGARAADATAEGLSALWLDSATATVFAVGVAMIVSGTIDAWQRARDQHAALIPTPEQAAADARGARGRR